MCQRIMTPLLLLVKIQIKGEKNPQTLVAYI